MRLFSRALRGLLALPLCTLLTAQHAADKLCEAWREGDVQAAPITVAGVAADRPVAVAERAVLASEVAQIASRGWRLGAELRLPLARPIVFPAGTALAPQYRMDRAGSLPLCLPLVPPDAAPEPAAGHRGGTGMLACLTDADGDAGFEQVDLYDTDFAMHVPQVNLARSLRLEAGIRLVEDPQGLARTRRHVHRRVEIYPLAGDTARLLVQHAIHDLDRLPERGAFIPAADGSLRYQQPAPAAMPADLDDDRLDYRLNDAEVRSVTLANGAVVEAGGLRFRVDRGAGGWTMTPLAARFPLWIRYGCGGRSLILGAQP